MPKNHPTADRFGSVAEVRTACVPITGLFGHEDKGRMMHIEEIRFDEVFDVQALRGDFSFSTRGRPSYGVNLGNNIIPSLGATFAVAFVKPGDWSTVLAWRDLASKKVKFKQPSWIAVLLAASDLILFGPLFIAGGLALAGEWIVAGVFAALFAVGVLTMLTRGVIRNRMVERALLAVG